jgi:DNA polymerase III delta subunit
MAIFCFFGNAKFLVEEKIKELNKKRKNLNYNKDFKDFFLNLQKITNKNLFNEEKILVLRNLEKIKNKELLIFISFLKENYQKFDFIFVFDEKPIDFIELLHKNKIKFEIIDPHLFAKPRLKNFILNYAERYNLKLPEKLIDFLQENYSSDIAFLFNDLKKLALLKNLTQEEMLKILHLKVDVFKIQDYFLEKNWPLFIHYFKKFIFEDKSYGKIETLKVLSLLFHSLIKIYLLKTNQTKKIKGNIYYLSRLKEKSKKLSIEDIKKLISAISRTERKFKKHYLDIKEIPEDISLNYLLQTP